MRKQIQIILKHRCYFPVLKNKIHITGLHFFLATLSSLFSSGIRFLYHMYIQFPEHKQSAFMRSLKRQRYSPSAKPHVRKEICWAEPRCTKMQGSHMRLPPPPVHKTLHYGKKKKKHIGRKCIKLLLLASDSCHWASQRDPGKAQQPNSCTRTLLPFTSHKNSHLNHLTYASPLAAWE